VRAADAGIADHDVELRRNLKCSFDRTLALIQILKIAVDWHRSRSKLFHLRLHLFEAILSDVYEIKVRRSPLGEFDCCGPSYSTPRAGDKDVLASQSSRLKQCPPKRLFVDVRQIIYEIL